MNALNVNGKASMSISQAPALSVSFLLFVLLFRSFLNTPLLYLVVEALDELLGDTLLYDLQVEELQRVVVRLVEDSDLQQVVLAHILTLKIEPDGSYAFVIHVGLDNLDFPLLSAVQSKFDVRGVRSEMPHEELHAVLARRSKIQYVRWHIKFHVDLDRPLVVTHDKSLLSIVVSRFSFDFHLKEFAVW